MTEYWQDKRIDPKHVACAWALLLVVLGLMVAITTLGAPGCGPGRDAAARACAEGRIVPADRLRGASTETGLTGEPVSRPRNLQPSRRAARGS